ncbi:MAG: right-handed parallel beta-helix repeat-containing protein [Acidobacteriota bacterium]
MNGERVTNRRDAETPQVSRVFFSAKALSLCVSASKNPHVDAGQNRCEKSRLKNAAAIALLSLLALLFVASPASAKIIHASPQGNDNNSGSLSQPVATPQRALEMAAPGDTIYFRAGRYTIKRFLWVGTANLTISSYPGEKAAIEGGTTEDQNNPICIFIIVADNVTLADLEIQGGAYYGVKVDLDSNKTTNGVTIRRCHIHHTGRDAIKTFNADNLLIEDCEIAFSGARDASNAEGIDSIASVGVTIRRCYIHDIPTNGLYLKGGARDGLVERNRIERVGHAGILLGQDTDLEYMRDGSRFEAINCAARNNIIVNAGAAGLGTYSGSNVRFENNTVFDVARQYQAAIWIVFNSREVPSEKISFKNNIAVVTSERPMLFMRDMADQIICDSNIYYNARNVYQFKRELTLGREQLDIWNFADWKRQGVDARSLTADPLLDSRDFYRPRQSSPAIDRGEALTEVKTDYAGNPRPQGKAYDIGAHEGAASARAATDEAATVESESSHALALAMWGGVLAVAVAAGLLMSSQSLRAALLRRVKTRSM